MPTADASLPSSVNDVAETKVIFHDGRASVLFTKAGPTMPSTWTWSLVAEAVRLVRGDQHRRGEARATIRIERG